MAIDTSPEAVERLREAVTSASLQVEFRGRVSKMLRALSTELEAAKKALKRWEDIGDPKTIVNRLCGVYRTPITDGLGPAGGEEPGNPLEHVRTFEVTPIQHAAAKRILDLEAQLSEARNALAIVASAKNNEITGHPYWIVVDPIQMMSPTVSRAATMVKGLFFSRESADAHITSHRHRYSDRVGVFCCSGKDSSDYRALYDASRALKTPSPQPSQEKSND